MVSENVQFHHTLVIAICSEKRHSMVGRTFPCPTETKETTTSDIKENTPTGPKKTIDLHTATSLIGRLDGLDMSLGDLRLHEHAKDGILTLYSVVRIFRHGDSNDGSVGKEDIFRFRNSWVISAYTTLIITTRKSPAPKAKRKKVMHVFCPRYVYSRQFHIPNPRKTVSFV